MSKWQLVEFNWDEQTQVSEYLYENSYTGETRVTQKHYPLPDPEVNQGLKDRYFANLLAHLEDLKNPIPDSVENNYGHRYL